MVNKRRWNYYRRIAAAYVVKRPSHLTFWHEKPEINPQVQPNVLGPYYMSFRHKADYAVCMDQDGIPLLNYHGSIGTQYNPIAIAQYGLGNYNLYKSLNSSERADAFFRVANWLVANLQQNKEGLWVWNHHFDWEYRTPLKAPWYSGLAQGQGISVLVRAFKESNESRYLEAASRALESFFHNIDAGGVIFHDESGQLWLEEYIVRPPTHILNGFIWASWGLYDCSLLSADKRSKETFDQCVATLRANLCKFDIGYWSLYELAGTRLHMIASPFYHSLHIAQLRIMEMLTGERIFAEFAERWERYERNPIKRTAALAYKALFKVCYY